MTPLRPLSGYFLPTRSLALLVTFLLLFPLRRINGCIFVYSGFEGYSFLNPAILDMERPFAPFLLSFEALTDGLPSQPRTQQLSNVEEWRERHCSQPDGEDIEYLIYKASIGQLQRLKNAVFAKNVKLDPILAENSFAEFIYEEKCVETIDYLLYARACEPHVVARNFWNDTPRDLPAMQQLINQGKALFLKLESHYIRLRYAYQMIRLAHYMGDYQQTLELYDYLMPKIDADPSILEDWILGHKAGALMGLGENVEASYLYSRIFENSPSKRETAWLSFHIETDEQWQACLNLCRTDRERANLYVLRAYGQDSRLLEEMQHIYELDPGNPDLDILLIREIQRLEKDLLGASLKPDRHDDRQYTPYTPRSIAGRRAIDLLAFVRNHLQSGQISRSELWKLAEGYLEMLTGDYYGAARTFEMARSQVKEPAMEAQLQAMELVLYINNLSVINDSLERVVAELYEGELFQSYEHFPGLMDDKLAQLYRKSGHPGKAFRTHYPLVALKSDPDPAIIDDLIGVCLKERRSPLERKMVVRRDGSTIVNDLYDLKATWLLSQGQVEAALETYKKIDRALWNNYGVFNPFVERLKPCVNCPLPDSVTTYNKGEVMERLVQMEYEAKADPTKSGVLFYKLGVAWLNMSYFGHAWDMADFYRSGGSLESISYDGKNIFYVWDLPTGNVENFNLEKALSFFDRSIALAKNPEIAARAAFMAAFCEQQDYWVSGKQRPVTYKYFGKMQEDYLNTEFYQYIIKECKYFAFYTTR